jgi:DNA-binding NarL/FixJ family response regulator
MNKRASSGSLPLNTAIMASGHAAKARLILVDDHSIVREGVAALIDREPDLNCCCWASSSREALQAIDRLLPDLVVTDITLDGSNGLDLIKDLKLKNPRLPVLVLSMHDENLYAERALRAGAQGYIMKCEPIAKILEAIRKVLRGSLYVSDSVTTHLLQGTVAGAHQTFASSVERLTDRELEVFEMIGLGTKTSQIAKELCISVQTVKTHREHIKVKLGLTDGLNLIRSAVQWVESGERHRPQNADPSQNSPSCRDGKEPAS